jgi:superfamily II DNA or RNA helicase
MIKIVVQNASWCRVLKKEEDWDIIWTILSYNDMTKDRFSHRVEEVKKSYFDRRSGRFGTGLLNFVCKKLDELNENYELSYDKINKSMKISKEITFDFKKYLEFNNIYLENYQEKVLKIIEKNKRGCIQSPTGSGKSIIGASIIKKFNIPKTIIIVPTKSIANGFKKELNKILQIPIGLIGDGEKNFQQVTIALYQSLRNIDLKELNKNINLVLCDEVHGSKCKSIQTILQNLPDVWYRYGLSATLYPKSSKKEWFAITSQFGEPIIQITDKEAESRIVPIKVEMWEFKTKTKNQNFQDIYRKDVLLNIQRCLLLIKIAEYFLDKVDNCLILVDEYRQAKTIQYLSNKIVPEIAWSGGNKDINNIAERLNNGKLRFCVATPVWKVGTNIPNIRSIVLGSARKSPIDTIQKIGRGTRKVEGKDKLLVGDIYDIVENYAKIEEFSKKRLNLYRKKGWI